MTISRNLSHNRIYRNSWAKRRNARRRNLRAKKGRKKKWKWSRCALDDKCKTKGLFYCALRLKYRGGLPALKTDPFTRYKFAADTKRNRLSISPSPACKWTCPTRRHSRSRPPRATFKKAPSRGLRWNYNSRLVLLRDLRQRPRNEFSLYHCTLGARLKMG